jgi:hypothetical protein
MLVVVTYEASDPTTRTLIDFPTSRDVSVYDALVAFLMTFPSANQV